MSLGTKAHHDATLLREAEFELRKLEENLQKSKDDEEEARLHVKALQDEIEQLNYDIQAKQKS